MLVMMTICDLPASFFSPFLDVDAKGGEITIYLRSTVSVSLLVSLPWLLSDLLYAMSTSYLYMF